MNDREKTQPARSDAGERARRAREERLAEALRRNLRKRKDQARGRAPADGDGGTAADSD